MSSQAHIVAIVNKKGGVGKTITTLNLGAALAENRKKVLIVDLDPQCSLTICAQVDLRSIDGRSLYDVLMRRENLELPDIIINAQPLNLDIVPANIDLDDADEELSHQYMREFKLKNALDPILNSYDFILLDCPPHTGLLTINALATADTVLSPVQADYLAMRGTHRLLQIIERIHQEVNPKLQVAGLLLTMVDTRTTHARSVVQSIREAFGQRVFETVIPYTVKLKDSPTAGESVLTYHPRSPAAEAYRAVAKEFLINAGK